MHWNLEHGSMNIWCEFEENQLKTLPWRVHTRKINFGPQVATNVTKMFWGFQHGPVKIWCEFEEDCLKTLLWRVHTRKNKVGPVVFHCVHSTIKTLYSRVWWVPRDKTTPCTSHPIDLSHFLKKLDTNGHWSVDGMPPSADWLSMPRSQTGLQKPSL